MKTFLEEELFRITAYWDGDFKFDVEQDDEYEDRAHFSVTVRLKHHKAEQSFNVMVDHPGGRDPRAYIETREDYYHPLNGENFFTYLWFDLVDKCESRS